MRFEARFHPNQAERADYVIVGYVIYDADRPDGRARVEAPATTPDRVSPHVMLATLRHMVRVAGPRARERLEALDSPHWSFVDVNR